jgi:alcohol dehydrogenase
MAEHCHLPAGTALFRVPPNLPDTVASPATCATATVAAVLRTAGLIEGQTIVIQGAGALGQTACAMAVDSGAEQIIALEPDAHRRDQALRFGATRALPPHEAKAIEADVVVEFAGVPESVELGPTLLRPGGQFVMAGSVFPTRPVAFQAEQIVRRMIRIAGVHNYAPRDLATALAFLDRNARRYPFAEMVERSFPLEQVNEAFEFAETNRPLRVALAINAG